MSKRDSIVYEGLKRCSVTDQVLCGLEETEEYFNEKEGTVYK